MPNRGLLTRPRPQHTKLTPRASIAATERLFTARLRRDENAASHAFAAAAVAVCCRASSTSDLVRYGCPHRTRPGPVVTDANTGSGANRTKAREAMRITQAHRRRPSDPAALMPMRTKVSRPSPPSTNIRKLISCPGPVFRRSTYSPATGHRSEGAATPPAQYDSHRLASTDEGRLADRRRCQSYRAGLNLVPPIRRLFPRGPWRLVSYGCLRRCRVWPARSRTRAPATAPCRSST